ncbi:NADH-quinone oxidoreductase subunit J [Nitrospira moscoviensis]|uniref:NADH-quinone oxidoreductase subunit J n=1 Tax=Nitrospira moscoviensis TaxID=42253 RepID=A0A0K2G7N0_NITMO|nr:NADH-quinone oxidoreductase subunit J [Nitrospira moscoviensis]ALA56971.1 NADH-quinone oxidoreductase, membrane subunit J [Nitrospira moscoviensis]
MGQVFFGYFAAVIALTAVLVVALKNPIYSALSLLVMFFHVAGLYVTLHAEFLAAVQIIVYAGAILVLYLFVVMLLNVKRDDRYHSQWRVAAFLAVPLLMEFIVLLAGSGTATSAPAGGGEGRVLPPDNTLAIGEILFSTYLFPFEVASLVLLVAMIGAIVLAKRDIEGREA